MTRKSDVDCPNCGFKLKQPSYESDFHEWDCSRCGLEIPRVVSFDGFEIIEAYRDHLLRDAIKRMLPHIKFGE